MKIQTRNQRRIQKRAGFTLIEVLLVLMIIGVIAAFAVPQLLGRQQKALVDATKVEIRNFEKVVQLVAIENNGVYPSGDGAKVINDLMQPTTDASGRQISAYLETEPMDKWGNMLQYSYDANEMKGARVDKPRIWSFGPDGKDDSGDEISNWDDLNM